MSPSSTAPARDQRVAVTREEVLAAARRIVEAGGVDSLSMRKLAADLGVGLPSIYRRVGGREQLLNQLVDQLVDELGDVEAEGGTPAERVASVARNVRRQVRTHPEMVTLANELGRGPATSFPGQVALARELAAAGLHGDEAAKAVRAILWMVGGFILVESLPKPAAGTRTTQQLWRSVKEPDLDAELVKQMRRTPGTDELFEYTLTNLIASIVPAAPRKRR